jgi:predicted transcriptional regulator of viral defense system
MDSRSVSGREGEVLHEIGSRGMVIFSPVDVDRFLGVSRLNTNRILSNMVRKGLAVRVERGKYALSSSFDELDVYEIVSEIFKPSYLAFWSALHYHGMTDQVPRMIFLVTTRRKRPFMLQGQWVRYVTLSRRFFFGYERNGKVVVSDREKTVIDCLMHPEYSGGVGQVFGALSEELEGSKLVEYCLRTGSPAVASRLGYLLDRKGLVFDREGLRSMIDTYTKLDPRGDYSGLDPGWKLYVNGDVA